MQKQLLAGFEITKVAAEAEVCTSTVRRVLRAESTKPAVRARVLRALVALFPNAVPSDADRESR
jgi:hypothetical protein